MTGTLDRTRQRTPEWIEARRDGITATDAAVIAGETGSVVELWADKLRLIDPPEFDAATRELMDEGLAIQPYLLDYWRRKNPDKRARAVNTMRRSRDWPIAMSSPDGEVIGEARGIEAKMTTSPRWPSAAAAGDPVPGDVFAQVQWQMFTAGWDVVDVVVLLFGRPKIVAVERDGRYIDDLVYLARDFWRRVEAQERPEMDGSENARRVLAALHPRNDGTLVPVTPEIESIALALRDARATAKEASATADTLENAVRALIGDADGIEGSFGKVTWRKNAASERTDWKLVADALAHEVDPTVADTIRGLYTRVVDGPRVLRCDFRP